MKRRHALQQLSREHHSALVLALRIARATDLEARYALLKDVPLVFQRDIAPHFCREEAELLPRLKSAGAAELVQRTLDEHEQMRELVMLIGCGELTALSAFGDLLGTHVRFEERVLFPAAEAMLENFAFE